jgi:hypothetical protein
MTIPFWCLFVVAFLPYVWFAVAGPARVKQLGKNFDPPRPAIAGASPPRFCRPRTRGSRQRT